MDEKGSNLDYNSNSSKRTCLYYGPELTLIIGLTFIAFGVVSLFGNNEVYEHLLREELGLSPDSKSYDIWHETPVPMYIEFYFFNWTNPDKLGIEKPAFTEMGPYRFRERQDKVDVTWNNENDTVSYRRRRFWYYEEDKSIGDLEDKVTTLNAVALTAAFTVRNWNYLLQKSLSMGLTTTGQKIFIRKSVRELLFDGYEDRLLNLARSMPSFKGVEIPFDRFGWFYTRNGSTDFDGYFNMETGSPTISKIGFLKYWNYANHTTFYDDHCARIEGSAGEFWPPNQKREIPLKMYSPDLCRSIPFTYDRDSVVNGVTGYTYILDKNLLDNGTSIPENLCYCNGECSASGVINVTSCHYGAPAFVSYPHFYQADPYYADAVDGMRPDRGNLEFYITIEPNIGIPMDVGARLQINLLLQPIENIDLYKDVPKVYFPMFWFNERATMPPEMSKSLQLFLKLPEFILIIGVCFMAFGVIIVFISSVLLFLRKRRRKTTNCYRDNIISVQMKENEPHSRIPLMGKTETSFDNSIDQTSKLVA